MAHYSSCENGSSAAVSAPFHVGWSISRGGQAARDAPRPGPGAERPASQEGGTVERHPALAQKLFDGNLAEKSAAVTPGDCGGRLVRVRYAPIATKFCGAPK
jgi:hypothetical protein